MAASRDGFKLMLWAVFFFGIGHAAVKWLPHIPFYQLVFLRAAITALLCLVILRIKKISLKGHNWKLLASRGVAGTIALTTYFYSLQNMPLASAVTIQYLSPILTLMIAHYFLKEKSPPQMWAYSALAFLGVLAVKGFDTRISSLALISSLVSVVASASAYNFVRLLRSSDNEYVIVFYFTAVTIPLVGPFAVRDWVVPTLRDWGFILSIGVFTQVAQVLMTMAYQRDKASDVAIINYFGILIALGIGYFFFNETFSVINIIGMFLILLSVWLGIREPKKNSSN